MDLLKGARRAYQAQFKELPQYGPGGGYASFPGFGYLSGTTYDYKTAAGPLYDNAIAWILINWFVRKLTQTRLVRQELQPDYSLKTLDDDEAVKAVQRANDSYDERTLWSGVLRATKTNGNGYWIKRRGRLLGPDKRQAVVGYFHTEPDRCIPFADYDPAGVPNDGTRLICRYRYTPIGGAPKDIWPEEVLHFRWPLPDPKNPMLGISELAALLRQIAGHNDISTHDAAVHRSAGMPGLIVSPKTGSVEEPTPEQKTRFRRLIAVLTGEGAGGAMMAPFAVDITAPGFSPEQMMSHTSRHINAAEICAALGLDPMAVHLFSESKTYANFQEAREDAIESALLPTLEILSADFTRAARNDFGQDDPKIRYGFDLKGFRELSEDDDKRHKRIRDDFAGNMLTLDEARELLSEEPIGGENGGKLFCEIVGASRPAPVLPDPNADPAAAAAAAKARAHKLRDVLLREAREAKDALEALNAR